jgi:NitT/TauT family transport system substrate-binding protein
MDSRTTFMIAFMFPAAVAIEDVRRYMNGLRHAQIDLDFEPEKYKHFYANEIPDRYKAQVDMRRFSTGERIVFLPYTEAVYARTQQWLHERALFEDNPRSPRPATVSV